MITREEIDKLATLSRLTLSDEEKTHMAIDIGSILNYVDTLKKAEGDANLLDISANKEHAKQNVHNVMREDVNPNEPGKNTEKLVNLAPQHEGPYIKVKKIL